MKPTEKIAAKKLALVPIAFILAGVVLLAYLLNSGYKNSTTPDWYVRDYLIKASKECDYQSYRVFANWLYDLKNNPTRREIEFEFKNRCKKMGGEQGSEK